MLRLFSQESQYNIRISERNPLSVGQHQLGSRQTWMPISPLAGRTIQPLVIGVQRSIARTRWRAEARANPELAEQ